MDKILSTLLVFLLFVCPLGAQAQEADETQSLAHSIYRWKTGESGHVAWTECGHRLSSEDALARSLQYATYFVEERATSTSFNPWIGASIAMQESSLDRCAISRGASQSAQAFLGHSLTEREVTHLLTNSSYRRSLGITTAFDAGLVQFRWPGVVGALVADSGPSVLVDARTSIHMLAVSMQQYHEACSEISSYRGNYTVNRDDGTVRTVRYAISCEDGFWVAHNSPSRFNYTYYRNVMHRYNELRSFVLPPTVPTEDVET